MEMESKQAKCVTTLLWKYALFEMGCMEELAIKQWLSSSPLGLLLLTYQLFQMDYNVLKKKKKIKNTSSERSN